LAVVRFREHQTGGWKRVPNAEVDIRVITGKVFTLTKGQKAL